MRVAKKPKKEYLVVLGKKLRYCRKSTGLTQKQLAELFDIDRTSVSYYETGKIQPPAFYLFNCANEFRLFLDDLADSEYSFEEFANRYTLEHFKRNNHRE